MDNSLANELKDASFSQNGKSCDTYSDSTLLRGERVELLLEHCGGGGGVEEKLVEHICSLGVTGAPHSQTKLLGGMKSAGAATKRAAERFLMK